MHMFCIRFSNRYSYWPNRCLIGPTNLDKTGFVILSTKGKGVWGNRYMFETWKSSVFVFSQKKYVSVWPNKASVLLFRVLYLPNRGSLWQRKTSVFIKQSLCLNQTGHLYMFDFSIRNLYAFMSQPWEEDARGTCIVLPWGAEQGMKEGNSFVPCSVIMGWFGLDQVVSLPRRNSMDIKFQLLCQQTHVYTLLFVCVSLVLPF